MELIGLIKKYGSPDAVIDYNGNGSKHAAIWGFKEIITLNHDGVCLNGRKITGNPMQLLQSAFDRWKNDSDVLAAVGYLSYDLKNVLFPHLSFKPVLNNHPLYWFGKPAKIREFDRISDIEPEIRLQQVHLKNHIDKQEYVQKLQKIKNHLAEGDVYQVNFTYPKSFCWDGNPLDLYLSLSWQVNPRRGLFLFDGKRHILSFSPEEFISVQNQNGKKNISTLPMKGTRPEGRNEFERQNNIRELASSNKDKAEHLMIIDLLRNDLGKICNFDSIHVKDLYGIQTYESVHHMVSKVCGELQRDISETDIINALFPGGSITGAPKESAIEIIDKLENYNRGIYTGAMGYITEAGSMDFNISIRTIEINNNRAVYPVGGGIVWDSDPHDEWQETQVKTAILNDLFADEEKNQKHKFQLSQ